MLDGAFATMKGSAFMERRSAEKGSVGAYVQKVIDGKSAELMVSL